MKLLYTTIIAIIPFLAIAERPINELPMRGGQHDPKVEKNSTISKDAAKRGWKAYYEGDSDKAIRRFNQAWMFDRENPQAYWGFGLVMQRRAEKGDTKDNLREAIELIAIARDKAPKDGRILGDLAFAHSILGNHLLREGKEDNIHLTRASNYFQKAYNLTPDYPPIIAHWAMHLFWIGDLKNAEDKVAEAQASGYRFEPRFLEDLEKYANANKAE